VIIDLDRFIAQSRPVWTEFEQRLDRIQQRHGEGLTLDDARRLHYLYQRTSADLAKIRTFSSEPETLRYLESLIERAYGEIHETRGKPHRLAPLRWFLRTFPQTFRRRIAAFWLALAVTLAGCAFGGLAVTFDADAKAAIMPWSHLMDSPAERVAREEKAEDDRLEGAKSTFSSQLMVNNIKVSINVLALGLTWGIGSIALLFYNGVILGAVAVDYILAGQTVFLLGWLLPHGSIEIPAILLAGQGGLVLAGALIGWGRPIPMKQRLREILPDLTTLIGGVAVMLVWAGLIEAFLSQYHEPVLPYWIKITFGAIELGLLVWFLKKSGAKPEKRGV
jgi:uncharacterized membrane protein SpoIIM required for sporulation